MVILILRYLFLFITGSILGWILEVFYRRYFGGARKWINPGFLSGPYLPIYGFGVSLLYLVSDLHIEMWIKIILFAIVPTFIEYIAGMFFLKYYKTRLWDYSNLKFNVNGLIAPLYTFFWTILALFFYYVMYPYFYNKIEFIYYHLEYSLFIGIFLGIMLQDIFESFGIVNKLKKFAELTEEIVVIDYERLKLEIREKVKGLTSRVEDLSVGIGEKSPESEKMFKRRLPTFIRPFYGNYDLFTQLKEHIALRYKDDNPIKNKKKVD